MMVESPAPKRILIIRPSALGDVCRTVPVLVSLRKAFPEARIEWIVQDTFAPAVAGHPALDELITFPRNHLAGWYKSLSRARELWRWLGDIRRRSFDLVLDCQGLGRSGLIAWASRAPRRVGLRNTREFAWLGYNVRVKPRRSDGTLPASVHTVDQMLALIEAVGVEPVRDMRLYVDEADRSWWDLQRAELGMDGGGMDGRGMAAGNAARPYAVLAPTSRWLSKRWPIERFGQLVEPLRARGFGAIVVIGSPGEESQVHRLFSTVRPGATLISQEPAIVSSIASGSNPIGAIAPAFSAKARRRAQTLPPINLVGRTTIGQTLAVIAQAGLVVANDSAPLHMAVGFNRPLVGLFGPTDPAVVGPYQMEHAVVRGYQARRGESIHYRDAGLGDSLMRLISTASVLQRIDRVLAEHSLERADEDDSDRGNDLNRTGHDVDVVAVLPGPGRGDAASVQRNVIEEAAS